MGQQCSIVIEAHNGSETVRARDALQRCARILLRFFANASTPYELTMQSTRPHLAAHRHSAQLHRLWPWRRGVWPAYHAGDLPARASKQS